MAKELKNHKNSLSFIQIGPTHPYRGGISLYTTLLHCELQKNNTVHLVNFIKLYPQFLFPGKTQFDTSEKVLTVDHEKILNPFSPITWERSVRYIRQHSPDMLIFQWWQPFMGVAYRYIASRLKKVCPSLFVCHNVAPHEQSWTDALFTRIGFSVADAFVIHSKVDAAALQEKMPDRLVVQSDLPEYNVFPDGEETQGELKDLFTIDRDRKVVLFFGLIRPYKGLRYLLEALACFDKKKSPVVLIAGEFYDPLPFYQNLIKELDIQDRVVIVPEYVPNEEVYRYFRAADMIVLPYISASQSAILQIAWSFACPIIASRVGGLPDIIQTPDSGLLVQPGNRDELYAAIKKLMNNSEAEKIKESMIKQKDRFRWSNMRKTIEDITRQLQQ